MRDLEALAPNLQLVDEMWQRWRRDPSSVDPSWRALFEPVPARGVEPRSAPPISERAQAAARTPSPLLTWDLGESLLIAAVHQLLAAFRTVGHLAADLDPLGMRKVDAPAELDPARYGLTEPDLERLVPIPALWGGGEGRAELSWVLDHLRETYARSIGAELMHVTSPLKRAWLCERLEGSSPPWLDAAGARLVLEQIASAQSLERFLHARYVGTKRFSLEGCETLVPLVDMVLEHAGAAGVVEVVIGMSHRGRLNLLVQIMGKRPSEIFSEFEDIHPEATLGAGDVKYHLGYSKDHVTRRGHGVHLSLAHNPSHLEAVDPVVAGRVRAKQRRLRDRERRKAMGLVIHGDAAFAGQGLVAETLNLSELHGYRTGGTVHVIINNQIGFTTPPEESRSTRYCSDVAKMLECPIFHVNGEDLGAVAHVVEVAMAYRQTFGNDVVIDLFCYRRYGHNEADEPAFTQPLLYRRIEEKRSVHDLWAERLIGEGAVTREEVDATLVRVAQWLEGEWELARAADERPEVSTLQGVWEGYSGGPAGQARALEADTGVEASRLGEIAARATTLPPGFHPHRKVARLFELRAAMGRGERPID
ncbi:MAG: 2-oxoglutarate dehydrogenase E1 component, partial [Deltaproteobacteria bacterium]|nr:2-oxoglutarate dehydrogenase E1 component [Deltaproteobacteria bacterium]